MSYFLEMLARLGTHLVTKKPSTQEDMSKNYCDRRGLVGLGAMGVANLVGNSPTEATTAISTSLPPLSQEKGGTGASALGSATLVPRGANVARALADLHGDVLNARAWGCKGDGLSDDTAAITALLSAGGYIFFPDGDYLIAAAGPSAGGVQAIVSRSTTVVCSPKARFFSNGLDNPLIQLSRNTMTIEAGLRPSVTWSGGVIDISANKISVSHPFIGLVQFSGSQGSAAVTDGLYLHGSYRPTTGARGTNYKNGWNSISIEGVTFYGGEHWQHAGGDSGVYPEGADIISVQRCHFVGLNDCGVYVSQSVDGTTKGRVTIRDNWFENCCHGAAIKRGPDGFDISHNTFVQCARCIIVEPLVGNPPQSGGIYNNRMLRCGGGIKLYWSRYVTVRDNVIEEAGAFLADGSTVVPDQVVAIHLAGCTSCKVKSNHLLRINKKHYGDNSYAVRLSRYKIENNDYESNNNIFEDNECRGWYDFAFEGASAGPNYWTRNRFYDCGAGSSTGIANPAIRSMIVNVDGIDGGIVHRNSVYYPDGTSGAPAIARAGSHGVGLYFASSFCGISVNGKLGFSVNAANCVFTKTPVPAVDNRIALGAPDARFSTMYVSTSAICSSDSRLKQQVRPLCEREATVARRLKTLIRAFKFNDAVREKGTGARIHVGVIAQDVKAAFESEGLAAEDYAIFCCGASEEAPKMCGRQMEKLQDTGSPFAQLEVDEKQQAGSAASECYGVRYSELLSFIIGAL